MYVTLLTRLSRNNANKCFKILSDRKVVAPVARVTECGTQGAVREIAISAQLVQRQLAFGEETSRLDRF